jgi:hypothetical protein
MDIITRGDFNKIDNYDPSYRYVKGDKIYMFRDNVHHIYECISNIPTQGEFIPSEWADIIDVFRGLSTDDILNKMYITEELFNADVQVNSIPIQYEGFDMALCKVVLFHSIQGRLSESEFNIENDTIYLNDLIMNPGEYMIIDIYEYDNKVHSDLMKPIGYVTINFVDLNGEPIRNTVVYKGDVGTSCDVYPAIINGYDFVDYEGELDGVFDIDPKNIVFKYVER